MQREASQEAQAAEAQAAASVRFNPKVAQRNIVQQKPADPESKEAPKVIAIYDTAGTLATSGSQEGPDAVPLAMNPRRTATPAEGLSDFDNTMRVFGNPLSYLPPESMSTPQSTGPSRAPSRIPSHAPSRTPSRAPSSARGSPLRTTESLPSISLDDLFARGIQHLSSLQPPLPLPRQAMGAFDGDGESEDMQPDSERYHSLFREISYLDTAAVAIKTAYAHIVELNDIVAPFRTLPWSNRRDRIWALGQALLDSQTANAPGTPTEEEIRRVKQEEVDSPELLASPGSGDGREGDVEMEDF